MDGGYHQPPPTNLAVEPPLDRDAFSALDVARTSGVWDRVIATGAHRTLDRTAQVGSVLTRDVESGQDDTEHGSTAADAVASPTGCLHQHTRSEVNARAFGRLGGQRKQL
eukprot:227493-Rhodomonas_salina.1